MRFNYYCNGLWWEFMVLILAVLVESQWVTDQFYVIDICTDSTRKASAKISYQDQKYSIASNSSFVDMMQQVICNCS